MTSEAAQSQFYELITENEVFDYVALNEKTAKYPPMEEGIIMRVEGASGVTEAANRNNRFYTNKLWERVLGQSDIKSKVKGRGMFGEADHPESFGTSVLRASHLVTQLWLESKRNSLMGLYEIFDVLPGRVIRTMFRAKAALGVSTRGAGNVSGQTSEGWQKVDEKDYRLSTVDFVIDPSAQNAYPKPIQEQLDELFRTPRDGSYDPRLQGRVDELVAMVEEMRSRELLMQEDIAFYKGLAHTRLGENRTFGAPAAPSEIYVPVPSRPRLSLRPVLAERQVERAAQQAAELEEVAETLEEALEETHGEASALSERLLQAGNQIEAGNAAYAKLSRELQETQRRLQAAERRASDAARGRVALQESATKTSGLLTERESLLEERESLLEETQVFLQETQEELEETNALLEQNIEKLEEQDTIITDLRMRLTKAQRKTAHLQERERAMKMMLVAKAAGVPLSELHSVCEAEGIKDLKEVEKKAHRLALSRLRPDLPRFELSGIQELTLMDGSSGEERQVINEVKSLVKSVGGYK